MVSQESMFNDAEKRKEATTKRREAAEAELGASMTALEELRAEVREGALVGRVGG